MKRKPSEPPAFVAATVGLLALASAMAILARCNKEQWSGFIFAGVGVGIVFAGLLGLAAGIEAWGSPSTWIVMGVVAAVLGFLLWRPLATNAVPTDAAVPKTRVP